MDIYVDIDKKINDILHLLENIFSESEINEVRNFLSFGEYGVAFETLCAIVQEEKINISKEVYSLIDEVGTIMELDRILWSNLMPPPQNLRGSQRRYPGT